MSKVKELIIHIGTPKTASSALQTSLSCNQALLSENDIYFLEYSWQKNAYVVRDIDWNDQDSLEQERKKLEGMIDVVAENRVLLSCSEYIGNLDRCFEDAREMAFKLDAITRKYTRKIVVYIRRQDEFIESTYAQYVKQGASYSFRDFMRQFDVYQFDWYRLIGIFMEVFGPENIVIRPYEKSQLYEGDVVRDFYRILGINTLAILQQHGYSNRGYSPAGLEIARVYNRVFKHNDDKKVRMKNVLQSKMPKQHFDKFYFFQFEDRKKILSFYEKSNRQLAREYLQRENAILFESNPDEYASRTVRKNGLLPTDIWKWLVAFFLRPLASRFRRILSS